MNTRMRALIGRALTTGLLLSLSTAYTPANGQPVVGRPPLASDSPAGTAQHVGTDHFDGIWRIEKPVFALLTSDGHKPPLKPDAQKVYLKHQADRKKGKKSFDGATWCASLGYPRALLIDDPFEIIVRSQHVIFLHQWNWWHNIVYFDGSLSKDDVSVGPAGVNIDVPGAVKVRPEDIPGSMGYSVGGWKGDRLVVETNNTVDTTLLDSAGLPHSDGLKIVTTWRLLSPNVLEARFLFDDAATYTKPWEATATFKRQSSGWEQEDVCLDRIKTGQPAVKEAL
ncbi:hypothetical protein WSK_1441 [Novosphingobium sp. Rr 2-17]|nr:hypothetical protein WSK_1441 [Novosphingobium sp. Rr 2-17]